MADLQLNFIFHLGRHPARRFGIAPGQSSQHIIMATLSVVIQRIPSVRSHPYGNWTDGSLLFTICPGTVRARVRVAFRAGRRGGSSVALRARRMSVVAVV